MSVAGYEITLDNAAFSGLGSSSVIDETLIVPDTDLGSFPQIDPPRDRQTQPANEGIIRPKEGINTISYDTDVSFIDLLAFNTQQKSDMVLVSDIAVAIDLGGLAPASLQGYIALARPGFYPVVLAKGTWDVISNALRDCAFVVPPSWGLIVRIERLDESVWDGDHTLFFTLNQLGDALAIAEGIAAIGGPAASGAIETQDEGATVNAATTIINFVGAGVTASDAGGGKTDVTIPGGAGAIPRRDVFTGLGPSTPGLPFPLPPLSMLPINDESIMVFLNQGGVYQEGLHYSIAGTAITWLGELLVPPISITPVDTFDIRYES